MNKKENRGITLVALVITIIVLLILAGVSINAIQNGGIITNAKNAKNAYDEGKREEETELTNLLNQIEANKVKKEKVEGNPDEWTFNKETGVITAYTGNNNVIRIPDIINGVNITEIDVQSDMYGVTFPFANLSGATITIPDTIKVKPSVLTGNNTYIIEGSFDNLEEGAFDGNDQIPTLIIPENTTVIPAKIFNYMAVLRYEGTIEEFQNIEFSAPINSSNPSTLLYLYIGDNYWEISLTEEDGQVIPTFYGPNNF